MNHHYAQHNARRRVLDVLHALTTEQVQALVAALRETPRDEQLEAMALTTELEEALPAGPVRRHVEAEIVDREDLREAAGNVPHRIGAVDLAVDTFDEILADVDRFSHVVDGVAFALTEFARHGMHCMHGRTARYRLLSSHG